MVAPRALARESAEGSWERERNQGKKPLGTHEGMAWQFACCLTNAKKFTQSYVKQNVEQQIGQCVDSPNDLEVSKFYPRRLCPADSLVSLETTESNFRKQQRHCRKEKQRLAINCLLFFAEPPKALAVCFLHPKPCRCMFPPSSCLRNQDPRTCQPTMPGTRHGISGDAHSREGPRAKNA